MNNHNPNPNKVRFKESTDVHSIVQEYMDSLLVDLFPDVIEDLPETNIQETTLADTVEPALTLTSTTPTQITETINVTNLEVKAQSEANTQAKKAIEIKTEAPAPQQTPEVSPKVDVSKKVDKTQTDIRIAEPKAKPVELRYPNAPGWAQQPFDVLLFDVCGLKLAVPMESLGKIIKVENETNHLIGRPNWFIGAYNENEQNLFVVDTARYIMPEKGFDLAENGYDFIIQLQRSQWTLACKKVYSTVRLEPNQVKWRSLQGKRRWLSGTVIDHMCALIHVDSLIDLLNTEAS